MNRKDFLELVSFVASVGGIMYYEELLEELKNNKCNISENKIMEEIKEIAYIFKSWLKEYKWSNEDVNYMKYVINISN